MSFWERMALRSLLPHEQNGERIILLDALPDAEALQALETRLRALREGVMLIGWKAPERNLDFPAYWAVLLLMFARGRANWGRYRLFMRGHGAEGVAFRLQRKVLLRRPLLGGSAVLLRLAPSGI